MPKTKGKGHTRVCWSCGKETMEPGDRGYRCRSCGATWNDIPEPGRPALTYRDLPGGYSEESKPSGTPW